MEQQENKLNTYTLDRIERKIREIVDASEGAEYIYRGEAQYHTKVCSGLYRGYNKNEEEEEDYDIVGSQKIILKKINDYLPETIKVNKYKILAQLQHYGARTNLIDFTPDFLIALYFACEKEMGKNGCVILLKRPTKEKSEDDNDEKKPEDDNDEECRDYTLIKPPEVIDRVKPQKSLFVESPTGFIEPDGIVDIPRDLKVPILTYIEKHHAISRQYIYNDIHGFIKSGDIEMPYLEFEKGMEDKNKQIKKEEKDFSKAISHYEIALKLKPEFPEAYSELGQIHFLNHSYDESIENYTKAICLESTNAKHYLSRGIVHAEKKEHEKAVKDFSNAIDKNDNDPYSYIERCKSLMVLNMWDEVRLDINTLKDRFEQSGQSKHLKLLTKFVKDEDIDDLPEDIKNILPP